MALDPFAPLRLGIRLGIGVVRFELHVIERLLGLDHEPPAGTGPQPGSERVWVDPEPEITASPPVADAEPVAPEPAGAPDPADLEPGEPAHLDVEPELVAEFAEPGAEEGAGAEVHVDEPWEGYRRMRVADIRDRVTIADPAQLAVVQLYESANRRRASILDAVERRSKELANLPS